jgi:hypothetical protein
MQTNYFVGVDPGRKGAIGCISNDGTTVKVFDMPPSTERGNDLHGLIELIKIMPFPAATAIEWNTGMPGEVPDFAFRFGLQTGQLHAAFYMAGHQITLVSPNTWKKYLGVPGKRDDPKSAAAYYKLKESYKDNIPQLWGPKGGIRDGRVDALLIAHWLRITSQSPVGSKGGKRPPRMLGYTKESNE